uniref:Myb/SANT-like DNA-binding domain-containing protein n=1 Tax=Amphimedon queenslandica TaxID=400682 RepID=A0A1X7U0Y4_AMPQE
MAWSNQEVKALLSIWGDVSIQTQLDGTKRNNVFLLISKKLQELGHCRDWKQRRCKIKYLKTMYKKVKDHNGVT